MRRFRRLPPPAALALLAGCSFVPTPERPEVAMPAAWTATTVAVDPAAVPVDAVWWTRFGNPELDGLVARALDANLDLAASLRRIDQARAQARIAGAGQLPTVGGTGSLAHRRQDNERTVATDTAWQGGLSASWEADLWGARAAAVDAATARIESARLDREALRLVVQSEVASAYFLALALRERIDIAERNLEAARRVLQLVETRFEQGATSALEVAQQRTAVASFQVQLPQLEQQRRTAENALAVLLGRPPQGFGIEGAGGLSDLVLPAVAPGQPADLLERRPDIRRVETDLRAADADIGIARAAFYPAASISLSGTLAGAFSGGATTTAAALAGALAAPIFSGGRLEGGVDLSYARRAELVETYGRTVLVAFREVEDALVAVETSRARTELQEIVAREARIAYDIAEARYDAGAVDFLAVLDAQRTLLSAEDALVQVRLARFVAALDLFAALGGGWAGG